MSSSLYDFNSTFFLSLGTLLISAFGICLGYSLKSKCSNVKCCYGCVEITRNIKAELKEDEILIEAGINPTVQIGGTAPSQNTTIRHRSSILEASKSPTITPSPSYLALHELNNTV